MVDSINKLSGAQPIQQTTAREQRGAAKTGESAEASGFNTADEVSLSDEARALSDVQQQASAARQGLENNPDVTLGQAERLQDFLA